MRNDTVHDQTAGLGKTTVVARYSLSGKQLNYTNHKSILKIPTERAYLVRVILECTLVYIHTQDFFLLKLIRFDPVILLL